MDNTPARAEMVRYLLKIQKLGYFSFLERAGNYAELPTVKRRLGSSSHQKPSKNSMTTCWIVGGEAASPSLRNPSLTETIRN